MILLSLLLAGQTALDSERALARTMARDGQWTALRAFAAPDAVVFTPDPVRASDAALRDRKNPPVPLRRRPTASYVACDGTMAVNTGSSVGAKGGHGYTTTVWTRQGVGRGATWRWVVDHGDALPTPAAPVARPTTERASCKGKPYSLYDTPEPGAVKEGHGQSPDGTLAWRWTIGEGGDRAFDAFLWNGEDMVQVVEDRVEARAR
ncbi:hypothetical protein ASE75_01265 [Sphingomonas sp. Leaf17]|uniref:hypothetical protein n=1 Tax=Sphingomonas sp. Leaf17 TaxID=1735683 RepID=UPI0006F876DA|nr:hypothetical protein [Sphingomonas sp. Leaf17]KQM67594.1 hypothetical protein ASE75_01265 [Sphingomonas sp. Leaf17]